MKLILEGPDNAGKTTFANAIRSELAESASFRYFHPGGPPAGEEAEKACMAEQLQLVRDNEHILLDRVTAISQQVYSPAIGDRHTYRTFYLRELLSHGAVVFYFRPSTDRLMRFEKFTWRDEETEEHKQRIIENQHSFIQRYDDLMHTVPCLSHDFDDPHSSVLRTMAREALKGSTFAADWIRRTLNYRTF